MKVTCKVASKKIYTDEKHNAKKNGPLRFLGNCYHV
ncbi:hypothetical protein PSEUDO8BK_40551 [Pseudomonas sp. 8BK]|nr:hypothetical protein PSEUDO8BK_40551 [Pseudomonas sp. 8BK]